MCKMHRPAPAFPLYQDQVRPQGISWRHCHGTRPVLNVYELEGAAGTLIAIAE
jgi:hypothetical protein